MGLGNCPVLLPETHPCTCPFRAVCSPPGLLPRAVSVLSVSVAGGCFDLSPPAGTSRGKLNTCTCAFALLAPPAPSPSSSGTKALENVLPTHHLSPLLLIRHHLDPLLSVSPPSAVSRDLARRVSPDPSLPTCSFCV